MLNEYMSMMVGIIVMYHGHVNKFIGDGILAIFCDDDQGAVPGDHALRAVQCATAHGHGCRAGFRPARGSTPDRRWWETSDQPIKWNIRFWETQ